MAILIVLLHEIPILVLNVIVPIANAISRLLVRSTRNSKILVETLDEKVLLAQQALIRAQGQRRKALQKLRRMGDTEAQNILEMEADEMREQEEEEEERISHTAEYSSLVETPAFDFDALSPNATAAFLADFSGDPFVAGSSPSAAVENPSTSSRS